MKIALLIWLGFGILTGAIATAAHASDREPGQAFIASLMSVGNLILFILLLIEGAP